MSVNRRRIAVLLCILLWPVTAIAADQEATGAVAPAVMATVTVIGEAEDQLSGKSELDSAVLQQLPRKNGSVAEAITVLPRVQAGEEQRTSERAGEILPPLISISGARPYENYYSVDGVGLNSLLDPLADNPSSIDSVPGHPQRTFLQRELTDTVTVYDSNIPARYGRFLGGVIDVETRNPASEFGGTINYRTTRDEWARQHIDPTRLADFLGSTDHTRQPDYLKQQGGFTVDIPLGANSGVLAAFSRTQSDLTLTHLGEPHDQHKTLDNYFLKYAWVPADPWKLELTGTFTPSDEVFFLKNTRDSDLTIKRGGYSFNGKLSRRFDGGTLDLSAAWLESENTRTAANEYLTWRLAPSTAWGQPIGLTRSQEGGFGDIDSAESSLQLRLDAGLDTFHTESADHTVSFGFEHVRDAGNYNRTEPAYIYNSSVVNPNLANPAWLTCSTGDPACISGEQYFNFRNVYAAGEAAAVIRHTAFYLEDLVEFGRFSLRPALRLSHDDFLNNTDLAPRLAGSIDLFGDSSTVLKAGVNRYFGEALMTYKLHEAITPYRRESRTRLATGTLTAWQPVSTATVTLNRFSSLDTPYSDEIMIGLDQKLFGGIFSTDYVRRRHRSQFARERVVIDGQNYYVLNNNGSSDYDSIALKWEREWERHFLQVNYTYTKSASSNESYDTTLEDSSLGTQVWYGGQSIDKEDLPRPDYYRPRVANIVYVGRLPGGFEFSNTAKYQSGYQAISALSNAEKTALGIPVSDTAYHKEQRPGYWMFDWRIDWTSPVWHGQSCTVSLEINNIFDKRVTAGDATDIYELGREFWFSTTYRF